MTEYTMTDDFSVQISVVSVDTMNDSVTDSVYSAPTKKWVSEDPAFPAANDFGTPEHDEARNNEEDLRTPANIDARVQSAISTVSDAIEERVQTGQAAINAVTDAFEERVQTGIAMTEAFEERVQTGMSALTEETSSVFGGVETDKEDRAVEEIGHISDASDTESDDSSVESEEYSEYTSATEQHDKGQFGDEIAPIDIKEQKKSVMDQLQDVAFLVFTGRIFDHMCDHVEVGLGLKEFLDQECFADFDFFGLAEDELGFLCTEEPPEQMTLKSNVNANFGLRIIKENGHIVISELDEDSRLAAVGFKPGMRILRINGERPKSMSFMHKMMKTKIQAVTENGRKKEVEFGVDDKHFHLHMARDRATNAIYISKIVEGSKLEKAGFKRGMRITKINGKPCPETYLKMVQTMMVKIEAVDPEDMDEEQERNSLRRKFLSSNIRSSRSSANKSADQESFNEENWATFDPKFEPEEEKVMSQSRGPKILKFLRGNKTKKQNKKKRTFAC